MRGVLASSARGSRPGLCWMAHAAVVAVLAVAVLLACLPPPSAAAAVASSYPAARTLRRLEMAAMDSTPGMREKADVTKGAEEDVSKTRFGAESEREVPTGPDPIHHHGRGPRRQSPAP